MPGRPAYPPPPAPRSDGLGWAFVPLVTLGWGTPFTFLYAALRRRSVADGVATAVYTVGLAGGVAGVGATYALSVLVFTLVWIIGTVHAFVLRSKVFPAVGMQERMNDQAVEVARLQRTLRARARKVLADDPLLAQELRIGRPDLPRMYDDGGLIDVNHAPAAILALLPGLTDDMVRRIVRLRDDQGGFVSVEELGVHGDLPPDIVASIAEYTVFVP